VPSQRGRARKRRAVRRSVGARRLLGTLDMPVSASRVTSLALGFLYVALACVGAIQLFVLVLEQYTMARFWEKWVVDYPLAGTYLPFCVIALASGILVGLVVGILAKAKGPAIAAWAGFCACILSFIAATAAGGITWAAINIAFIAPPFIAGGLLLGALAGRKLRHA